MTPLGDALRDCLSYGEPAVFVRVVEALGSTPREAGAAMLVTRGLSVGTIGGGALEHQAMAEARAMIAAGRTSGAMDVPLGPAIGQCCGGRVRLSLDVLDAALVADEEARQAALRASQPLVLIFGAGHTGRALAAALSLLPMRVRIIDSRPETLAGLPDGVETSALAIPEAAVAEAPTGSAFLVMTHDHALDFLIAATALARRDAAYVGMIGSATKREKFRRYLCAQGNPAGGIVGDPMAGLTLPIGGTAVRDKRPEVIAALTAAELVTRLLATGEERSSGEEKPLGGLAGPLGKCHSASVVTTTNKAAHNAPAS